MIPQRLNFFIFLGQLWKSKGTSLKNKDDVWESNDEWNFLSDPEGTKFYIENTSNCSRVATVEEGETNDHSVKFVENRGEFVKKTM